MDNLPDTLGELLELALQDLRKCEESEEYNVNMLVWYETNGKCDVCMAGSIIAQSLEYNKGHTRGHDLPRPIHEDNRMRNKMNAINELRNLNIKRAIHYMQNPSNNKPVLDWKPIPDHVRKKIKRIKRNAENSGTYLPEYETDRDGFMKTMEALASELKRAEL